MHKFRMHIAVALALAVLPSTVHASWSDINLPVGVTEISQDIYNLHMLILWICVAIGVVVYGVMFYSLYKYRKSLGAVPDGPTENHRLELVWTIIPILILAIMAVPATYTLIRIYDDSPAEINIKAVGYQWKWEYQYQEEDISFFSNLTTSDDEIQGLVEKSEHYLVEVDNPIVIPVDTKVRFLITAADVLHAFWVPAFGMKKDAIPGYINSFVVTPQEKGIYRGQCTELCGADHGFMPIEVHVVSAEEYSEWKAEQRAEAERIRKLVEREWTLEELVERGEGVYLTSCSACHQGNGQGLPPTFPSLVGTPVISGDLDAQLDVLVNGVNGTAMQAFGPQLSEADLAAVIAYTRYSWGNEELELEYATPKAVYDFMNQ